MTGVWRGMSLIGALLAVFPHVIPAESAPSGIFVRPRGAEAVGKIIGRPFYDRSFVPPNVFLQTGPQDVRLPSFSIGRWKRPDHVAIRGGPGGRARGRLTRS